jgi:polyisoprenoid-binding protein YceI
MGALRCLWLILAAALLLVACAPQRETPITVEPSPLPRLEAAYRALREQGVPSYRIDPAQSHVTIRVSRTGSLARLGHDHLVVGRQLQGWVAMPADGRKGQADLVLGLTELEVDDAEARRTAGMEGTLNPADVAGTRTNMLGPVLEAEQYPWVLVHAEPLLSAGALLLAVDIRLHGQQQRLEIPVRLQQDAAGLSIRGGFSLRQSDFGITPYSVMGGALRVEDRIDLQFSLQASRW